VQTNYNVTFFQNCPQENNYGILITLFYCYSFSYLLSVVRLIHDFLTNFRYFDLIELKLPL